MFYSQYMFVAQKQNFLTMYTLVTMVNKDFEVTYI